MLPRIDSNICDRVCLHILLHQMDDSVVFAVRAQGDWELASAKSLIENLEGHAFSDGTPPLAEERHDFFERSPQLDLQARVILLFVELVDHLHAEH